MLCTHTTNKIWKMNVPLCILILFPNKSPVWAFLLLPTKFPQITVVAPTGQSELTYIKDERSAFALSIWPLYCLLPFFSLMCLLDAPLLWLCVELKIQQQPGVSSCCARCRFVVWLWEHLRAGHHRVAVTKPALSGRKVLSCKAGFSSTGNLYFILQRGDSDTF